MREKKSQPDRTTRVVPTTPLCVRLNSNGELDWGHDGLDISRPELIGMPPNCVLMDIREYNRLNGKVTK